jgi:hypothetical protein
LFAEFDYVGEVSSFSSKQSKAKQSKAKQSTGKLDLPSPGAWWKKFTHIVV